MIADIRFYRDQDHRPRVQATEDHVPMADYLESDLQDSATASDVIKILEAKKFNGESEISGNSCTVLLAPDTITIESMFDDEAAPYKLPLAGFRQLVTDWMDFLDDDGLLSLVPKYHPTKKHETP